MIESKKRYELYERIRDDDKITSDISNTKKLILKLMQNDNKTKEYCIKKMLEEEKEVKDAIEGKHFHQNMTKREILVNEISQYIYWQTVIAVSQKVKYEEFNEEEKIIEILKKVDIRKLGEIEDIIVKEIINHDLQSLREKEYFKN
jgi:phosphoribosyl-ATP pyrophosphohydrolase